jgi:nitrite reductase (NADH) large subunit
MDLLDVVIVGAGPAGARCADHLAEGGARVTLIGGESAHPYNRVALSLHLAGDLEEHALITHEPDKFQARGVVWRPGTEIAAIDRETKAVVTASGERIPYGALVLATGAEAVRLPLPGADGPNVLLYRTLDDVRRMIAHAAGGGEAIVIGGGLLGLEAAAGLARRGMRVTVLHAVDRLMERQLDAGAAGLLRRRLAEQGITVLTNAKTVAIEPEAILLADGSRIPASLVVMAVGIRPRTALARAAGLPVGRGVQVDDTMRTADPAIWAVGECAEHNGVCVGLVAPCFTQAEVAANAILGREAAYRPAFDYAALKVAGAGVWSAGEIEGGEPIVLDDGEVGQYRRLVIRDDRLVGAVLYGDVADAPWYLNLIKGGRKLGTDRATLPFGPALQEQELAA